MKRSLIVFLLIILTKITSFSENISNPISNDSTVSITTSDLKYANLIFVEHKKLLRENYLLKEQVNNYIELNKNLMLMDSIKSNRYSKQVIDLEKELDKRNTTIKVLQIGGISVTVGLILFLFLK